MSKLSSSSASSSPDDGYGESDAGLAGGQASVDGTIASPAGLAEVVMLPRSPPPASGLCSR